MRTSGASLMIGSAPGKFCSTSAQYETACEGSQFFALHPARREKDVILRRRRLEFEKNSDRNSQVWHHRKKNDRNSQVWHHRSQRKLTCSSKGSIREQTGDGYKFGSAFSSRGLGLAKLYLLSQHGEILPRIRNLVCEARRAPKFYRGTLRVKSKFEFGAVTDDQEALTAEKSNNYDTEVSANEERRKQENIQGKEPRKQVKIQGRTGSKRRQKKNLGSYATTTAIALQGSLPPEGFIVLISCAVGLLTGACVVLFNQSITSIHDIVWDGVPDAGAAWLRNQSLETSWQRVVLIPAAGGLAVGVLNTVRKTLEGTSQDDRSFWNNAKVFVRPVLNAGAAAITLGTGNALGPEGPSVEIGASIAQGMTRVLRNSRSRTKSLVAAGSAAGISSGFNAAVAGCFFAVESVLSGLSSADSAPSLSTAMILLSSVLASVVSQAGLGSDPAFHIPAYDFRSPAELPVYLLLGVLCGGVSVALLKGTAYASTLFELLSKAGIPSGLLPPLGGSCVGVIALAYPEILYWGFENVDVLLESNLQGPSATLLLELVGAKILATSLCRGSGLVGGVYAPSLFIGAALGSAYGSLAKCASGYFEHVWHLDFLQVADPQAYALVGMAATLAGVCQVPLTSVLLLFELTRDYRIILPLMAAVGLSSWVASTFQRNREEAVVQISTPMAVGDVVSMTKFQGEPDSETVDAVVIKNSGSSSTPSADEEEGLCNVDEGLCLTNAEISEERLTGELLVISAMRTRFAAMTGDTPLREAMTSILKEREWCALIVNQDNHIEGLVTLSDIQHAIQGGQGRELETRPISSVCRNTWDGEGSQLIMAYPDMTLRMAQRLMAGRGLRQIPVVAHSSDAQGKIVLGLLDTDGIKLACRAEATRRMLCCQEL